jgi:hypothetical protein
LKVPSEVAGFDALNRSSWKSALSTPPIAMPDYHQAREQQRYESLHRLHHPPACFVSAG